MENKHHLQCEAPICADTEVYEDNPNWQKTVPWYPAEEVCGMKPFTKWQSRQSKMNRWHAKGELKTKGFFTVETLLRGSKINKGRTGGNPDAEVTEV